MDIKRKKRYVLGLLDKLCELLDNSQDIFFEERPNLLVEDNLPLIIKKLERRDENEKQIIKTGETLDSFIQEEIQKNDKEGISEVVKQVKLL